MSRCWMNQQWQTILTCKSLQKWILFSLVRFMLSYFREFDCTQTYVNTLGTRWSVHNIIDGCFVHKAGFHSIHCCILTCLLAKLCTDLIEVRNQPEKCDLLFESVQTTATSSKCWQLWRPIPLWEQEMRVEELVKQLTSSSKIGPVPCPYLQRKKKKSQK